MPNVLRRFRSFLGLLCLCAVVSRLMLFPPGLLEPEVAPSASSKAYSTKIQKLRRGYYFLQHFCIKEDGSLVLIKNRNRLWPPYCREGQWKEFPVANEVGWHTLNATCVHGNDIAFSLNIQWDRVAHVLPTTYHWGWHSLHGMVRATRVQLDHASWYPTLSQRFTYYLDGFDMFGKDRSTDWSNTFYPVVFGNEYYFSDALREEAQQKNGSAGIMRCYNYGYVGAPRMRTKNVDNQIKAREFNALIEKIQHDLNIRYDDSQQTPPLVVMVERISSRAITNWHDLVRLTKECLEPLQYQVQVMQWETMSVLKQARIASQAVGMIGMHGNGLVWTMMMKRSQGILLKLLPMYSHVGKTNMGRTGVNTDPNSNYGWIADKRNVKRIVWQNTHEENHHCAKNVDPKKDWRECNTTVDIAEYRAQLEIFSKSLDQ